MAQNPLLSPQLTHQLSLPLDSKDITVPHFVALWRFLLNHILEGEDVGESGERRGGDCSRRVRNKIYAREKIEERLNALLSGRNRQAVLIRALRESCEEDAPLEDLRGGGGGGGGDDDGRGKKGAKLDSKMREVGMLISEYFAHATINGEKSSVMADYADAEIDELMFEDVEVFRHGLDGMADAVGRYIVDLEKTIKDMVAVLPMEKADIISIDDSLLSTSRIPGLSKPLSTPITVGTITTTRRYHSLQSSSSHHDHRKEQSQTSSALLTKHQQIHNHNLTQTLPNLLSNLSSTLHFLLQTQTLLLKLQIKHLETFTHSTQSRHLSTHASFLATVSKGISLKATILSLLREKEIYAEENVKEALRDRFDELLSEERELEGRESRLRGLLGEYSLDQIQSRFTGGGTSVIENNDDVVIVAAAADGSGKTVTKGEQMFRTLGGEYARLEREIEEVKLDIQRLEGGDQHGSGRGVGGDGGGRMGRR